MAKDKGNNEQNQGTQSQPSDTASTSAQEQGVFLTLSKSDLLDLIREARRDPRLEEKLDAEAARVKRRRDQMIRIASTDEKARKARQASCGHMKPDRTPSEGGQEFSDGKVRIFCLRCQKVLRTYWTPDVARGMAIQAKMDKLGLTEADVMAAMEVNGEGDITFDTPDDFALGMPRRHPGQADLTTENQ